MTEPATQPATGTGAGAGRPAPEWMIVAACAALVVAASLSFGRVFLSWGFLRPVGAAILLSLGGQLLARRAGAGGLAGLAVGLVAWAMFIALAFLPSAGLLGGVLPTLDTLQAGVATFARGVELMQTRPPPTFAEPELLVLVVTGVWWIAHAVDVLAVRLRSPLHAIAAALVLWTVPLALTHHSDATPWTWAVPVLAAAVVLLLVSSRTAGEHGTRAVGAARRAGLPPLSGWISGTAAILAGVLLVSQVPGFDDQPLVRPGSGATGGLTRTDNPIVDLKPSLVDQSNDPVLRVQSSEPVYLRWTSLDRYTANERWTNDGLSGRPLNDPLAWERQVPVNREVEVEVESVSLRGQVLVPAPYHPRRVESDRADDMRWDPDMATLTMAGGEPVQNGDTYRVTAAVPAPPADQLRSADLSDPPAALTHLPSVPDEVAELAERIVEAAGADTAFDKAMALQEELRSWRYSVDPPPGHSGSDMVNFITNRVGYCEQFAGTMAVMLRSLDIPARVAVGFTPGEPIGEDEFRVRRRHAHAWVEVRFPGFGWIPFEPTPRDDGNLLTPTPDTPAPTQLDSDRAAEGENPDVGFGENEVPSPEDRQPEPPEADPDASAAGDDGAAGEDGDGAAPWWWLAAAAVGLAGAGTVAARRHARHGPEVPAEAVLVHVERVERLGAGLGRLRAAHETDAEYIRAVAPDHDRAEPLIAATDRARWAHEVPREAAATAADAASEIRRARLAGLSRLTRAVVGVRGRWHMLREWLQARVAVRRPRAADDDRPTP